MMRKLKNVAQIYRFAMIVTSISVVEALLVWLYADFMSDKEKEKLMLWAAVLTASLTFVLVWFLLSRGAEVIKSLEKRKEETDSGESSDGQGEVP